MAENPVVLRIAVAPSKTIDDVVSIARTEGRKTLGRPVDITDIVRRSTTMFWVEVRPKWPSLDVEVSENR